MLKDIRHSICLLLCGLLLTLMACHKDDIALLTQALDTHTGQRLEDICFVNDSIGYICGGSKYNQGVLLRTTDGGKTWTADSILPKACYSMYFLTAADGFIAAFDGYLAHTPDSGHHYYVSNLPDYRPLQCIRYADAQHGVAVSGLGYTFGAIYTTSDGGSHWQEVYRDSIHSLMAVACPAGSVIIAGGYGTMLRSTDFGQTWKVTIERGDFYQAIDFVNSNTGYAVGYQGEVLSTHDQGETWATVQSTNGLFGAARYLTDVDFINTDEGYAVGESGYMIHTSDGGQHWQTIKAFTDRGLRGIHLFHANAGIVVGEDGHAWSFKR